MALCLLAGPWRPSYGGVPPALSADEHHPAGSATVAFDVTPSSTLPAANLDDEHVARFHAGKALARQPWVIAPTATQARDGLGPLYNTRTCLTCHVNGGRGIVPDATEGTLPHGIVLLSVPGDGGPAPEPTYGSQLQTRGIGLADRFGSQTDTPSGPDALVAEASIHVTWETSRFTYPDGETVILRRPHLELRNLGYGPMHPAVMTSLRNAPPLHGTGLLSLVDSADIEALADSTDHDGDGISGRVNRIVDPESGEQRPGRFGWKAERASLREQIGAALQQDLGLSNPVFPTAPCSPAQIACLEAIDGADEDGLEVPAHRFELLVDYNRHIGVPMRRKPDHPKVRHGRELFHQVGCADCHHPRFRTVQDDRFPALAGQTIWPYTDLLIHDMGKALADGRPAFSAGPREWRTPPLWGLGLSRAINGSDNLLHDGRARSVEEAILWHGGEADSTRKRFTRLTPEERDALEAFVRSL